jgi:hypothetical protein
MMSQQSECERAATLGRSRFSVPPRGVCGRHGHSYVMAQRAGTEGSPPPTAMGCTARSHQLDGSVANARARVDYPALIAASIRSTHARRLADSARDADAG